jgi:hypothetical protein
VLSDRRFILHGPRPDSSRGLPIAAFSTSSSIDTLKRRDWISLR